MKNEILKIYESYLSIRDAFIIVQKSDKATLEISKFYFQDENDQGKKFSYGYAALAISNVLDSANKVFKIDFTNTFLWDV